MVYGFSLRSLFVICFFSFAALNYFAFCPCFGEITGTNGFLIVLGGFVDAVVVV